MQNDCAHNEKTLLDEIVKRPALHARFLQTLSLMELAGAQKLSRLLTRIPITTFLLEHVAEEYRHAFYLLKLAKKIGDGLSANDVTSGNKPGGYIHHLDRKILLAMRRFVAIKRDRYPMVAYLLTTSAVEQRALPFYRLYQSVLDNYDIAVSVKSIISEEEHHLREVMMLIAREDIPCALMDECYAIEADLYNGWIGWLSSKRFQYMNGML